MSFIRQHFESRQEDHREEDDILLAFGLALVTIADGGLDDEEAALLDSYRQTLPDWRLLSRSTAFNDAVEARLQGVMEKFLDGRSESELDPLEFAMSATSYLAGIQSKTVRRRCFVLGVDLAMAAGGITDTEDAVLEKMAEALELGDGEVQQIVDVLAWKYRP